MKTNLLGTEAARSIVAQRAAMVLAGIGILAASAWLSVPFYPVPLTMQTLAVLLVGGMLGPALGMSSVMGYLALGALGAPVFHGGLGGVVVIAGPTGGYLLGFIPAAFIMGWAARLAGGRVPTARLHTRMRRLVVLAVGALVASAVIYLIGVPWLALATGMRLEHAVAVGLRPFLLGDLLKAAVAVGAVYLGGRALSQWRPSLF
jgi:biotin transport system substrate-specific component